MDKSKIIEAAQQFTLRGQISKAIEEWKKLLTDTAADAGIYNTIGDLRLRNQEPSEAVEAYLRAGEVFHGSGFIAKAIAVYQKLLKIDPNHKDIYLRLADMNVERGMIGNARENYLKAARICTQGGRVRESLEIFRKIADLDPENLSVRLKIAEACLKEGLQQEAVAEYLKIAEAHVQKGEMTEAENIFRQVVGIEPGNQKALLEMGRFNLSGDHPEVAMDYAQKILETQPGSVDALILLQETYFKMGQHDKAEDTVRKLIALDPGHLPHQEVLAAIAIQKKNFPLAQETLVAIGSTYIERGEYPKAIENLQPLLKHGSVSVDVMEILFRAYLGMEDKEQIIRLGLQLAQEYDQSGDAEKTRETYIKILEWDPQNEEAEREIRRSSPLEGSSEDAPESTQDASSATWAVKGGREEKIGEHLNASLVYLKYGLVEKAIHELQEALTLDPVNESIHLRLKEVYLNHQPEKAADVCFSLATLYEEKGEVERAVSFLKEGLEVAPEHAEILSRLRELDALSGEEEPELSQGSSEIEEISEMWEEASFYAQQGMTEEAIRVCREILSKQPEHQEAASLLQRIQGREDGISESVETEILIQTNSVEPDLQKESDSQIVPMDVLEEASQAAQGFFNLEAALQKESPGDSTVSNGETRSFEDIFQEFQEGIRSKFGEEDYETHYNLGVAYKEMGLLDEASEEFQISIRSTERYFDSANMLAECYRETGRDRQALEVLDQAIVHPGYMDSRHKVLKYEKGLLLEKTDVEQALKMYYDLYNTDPTYRDIGERILRLKQIPSG